MLDHDLADRIAVLGVAGGGVEGRRDVVRLVSDVVCLLDLLFKGGTDGVILGRKLLADDLGDMLVIIL